MDSRIENLLQIWDCHNPRALSGDAGARQYFRVDHPQVGTAIMVLYPEPVEGKDDPYYDYRALQSYLDPVLRVPTSLQHCDELRAMLVEDVGDWALEKRLTLHPEEEHLWAAEAAQLLATWAGVLSEGAPQRAFFMLRSFDAEKYEFEWEYCKTNFFGDFLQKDVPKWLDRLMDGVHQELIPRARYLAHRDFHVRNLMVRGKNLVTLDFQDARRAPACYDLASILFDGYWDWNEEAQSCLVNTVAMELNWSDRLLWEELNLCALQRNFKALGTFGHQIIHRKKAYFAPAIPRTLRHIRSHFHRMNMGEGVLAAEHWLRLAEQRLLGPGIL